MIETIAGYVAPAATMIAAMMTASNLGTRITGWGFVIFSAGAVAWVIVAMTSGQQNLLLSNAFLLVINVVGIWRWLGRQSAYDDGARVARDRSAGADSPTLFPLGAIAGKPLRARDGATIATAVEAMGECGSGAVSYLVVSRGGIGGVGETLHAVGWQEVVFHDDGLSADLDDAALAARPILDRSQWPESARAAGVR